MCALLTGGFTVLMRIKNLTEALQRRTLQTNLPITARGGAARLHRSGSCAGTNADSSCSGSGDTQAFRSAQYFKILDELTRQSWGDISIAPTLLMNMKQS